MSESQKFYIEVNFFCQYFKMTPDAEDRFPSRRAALVKDVDKNNFFI